jgi:hypothetical protein
MHVARTYVPAGRERGMRKRNRRKYERERERERERGGRGRERKPRYNEADLSSLTREERVNPVSGGLAPEFETFPVTSAARPRARRAAGATPGREPELAGRRGGGGGGGGGTAAERGGPGRRSVSA